MSTIQSLQTLTLDLPPSCIEFYPEDFQYAVVGTYNLEKQEAQESSEQDGKKKPQSRNGSLILVQVAGNEVKIIQTLPTPSAILDIHFISNASHFQFGVATSTGSIGLYSLDVVSNSIPKMEHVNTIRFFPEDVLITAFSWHPGSHTLGMTLSSGQLCLGRCSSLPSVSGTFSPVDVMMHDLEAWTLAFISDGSGVLSGGDDAALRFTELPQAPMDFYEDTTRVSEYAPWRKSPWADKKIHGAGVTAILPIDWDESGMLVVTGSYDDTIRLIEIPSIGRRQVLAESNLGGGVWRLKMLDAKYAPRQEPKWHPKASDGEPNEVLLLVSCMHAGARIVKLSRDAGEWQFDVLARFEEHKSMNYGSDCQPLLAGQDERTVLSTSFYDRLLCLWRY